VPVANTVPGSAPIVGGVLMVPRTVLQTGSPGEPLPIPSFVIWASSGGAASPDGVAGANNGISNTTIDGQHTLTVGSDPSPTNDAESAIVTTLDPGAYTAIVRGANNATGIALIEVYDLDPIYTTRLANISTRGFINSGDNVMIGGFILLGGTAPTKVVVRGI